MYTSIAAASQCHSGFDHPENLIVVKMDILAEMIQPLRL